MNKFTLKILLAILVGCVMGTLYLKSAWPFIPCILFYYIGYSHELINVRIIGD